MKIGIRKPNLKKSLKARTTGRIKRAVKKSINPLYGKKGMGLITNPQKAIYNKVYSKTTVGVPDIVKSVTRSEPKNTESTHQSQSISAVSTKKPCENKNQSTSNHAQQNYYFKNGNTIYIGKTKLTYTQLKNYKITLLLLGIFICAISLFIMPLGILFMIFGIIIIAVSGYYKKIEKDFLKYRIKLK